VREALSAPEWLITESGFDLARAAVYETLCTVGNGYLGTRGTLEEGHPGDLSGTYLNGGLRRPRLPRDRPGQCA
jgi:kojibiose phosphorylase